MRQKEIYNKSHAVQHLGSSLMFHGRLFGIMGTRLDILLIGKDERYSQDLWNRITSELDSLEQIFNRFDPDSETSFINREATLRPVPVSREMGTILKSCRRYYERTLGLFDVTIGNFDHLFFDEGDNTIFFASPNVHLDFGGYAKGYALVMIRDIIRRSDIEHCFVDFGNSSILGMGHHPFGDAWLVSVTNPFRIDEVLEELPLNDEALSVSGDTPSYMRHILHPLTRKPTSTPKLVSVITDNPL